MLRLIGLIIEDRFQNPSSQVAYELLSGMKKEFGRWVSIRPTILSQASILFTSLRTCSILIPINNVIATSVYQNSGVYENSKLI